MVEIFKTNVQEVVQSEILIQQLLEHYPNSKINFDLEDCDCILRIAAHAVIPEIVISVLAAKGYQCELLS
jgi:hypothetical protein